MPGRKSFIGQPTAPRSGGFKGGQLGAAPSQTDYYYFVQVSGSDHFGIDQNPTSGPLKRPNGALGEHLEVRAANASGSLTIQSIDGSDHLQISG